MRTDRPYRAWRARDSRRERARREIDYIDRVLSGLSSPQDDESIAAYQARRAVLVEMLP